METASDDYQQDSSGRPQRVHRPPQHLAQYDVTLLPSQKPEAQASSTIVGQLGQVQSTRARSLTSYRLSVHSRRSSCLSYGHQLLQSTPDIQTAALEEQIKGLELADLKQELEEERKADLEAAALDAQAREGQRLQEEGHLAKERMARDLARHRRLKKLEKEVHIASLVKSYLSGTDDDVLSTTSAPTTFSKLPMPSCTAQQPPLLPSVFTQPSPMQKQTPVPIQVQPPSTVSVTQTLAAPASPVTSVQTGVRVTATPTAAPLLAPAPVSSVGQPVPAFPPSGYGLTMAPAAGASQTMRQNVSASLPSHYPLVNTGLIVPPPAVTAVPPPPAVQYASSTLPVATQVPAAPPWTYPGMETLIAASYGIPKPTLPDAPV